VGHADFHPAEVLDTAGAADLLRVDEAAIVDLATKGELPGRKIGDQWRFSRAALLGWLG
jgi:excisionase family DNA binding protein